jgi:predicted deacetylase
MNICIDYDDFHSNSPYNCLATLYDIIEEIPKIKITLFTTPLMEHVPIGNNEKFCKEVKYLIKNKNVALGIHGTYHTNEEFKSTNYEESGGLILKSKRALFEANLPYIPIFKAPNWSINIATIQALENLKFTHIFMHSNFKHLTPSLTFAKSIFYNWNLADPYRYVGEKIIAHGHVYNTCNNGISETSSKLICFLRENKDKLIFKFGNEL